ncbi:Major facilitator superfamily domain general substrate transporter [Penicillium atrosanguineum]|uniref:Bacteriophage T5 Orf172 DNA-binding domain-containing protein n=1 Tax=Penicillium atrosanguineum TaxID=1132637 RepID=A0A9W9PL38_9EURO|nr:Major facilitator superfamily domain general substrate transporter [Penicillium atrosanguineum]KAJ5118323.1 hypothetical protein N7526_009960 [Penicillium atrosanguineum]KAJ5296359.1 Major facilitator superfamily domain general substrate transporter [Penicillium atrosanguineum]KAJ5299127.1 hypothetical protein N7476_010684 [Penicillium atrosanguineum]
MESSKATFCSLSALLERTHCEHPKVPCSYLVQRATAPCSQKISQKNCKSASPFFPILLKILSQVPNEDYKFSKVVNELAKLFLCRSHLLHVKQARRQWLGELNDNKTKRHLLQRLRELYDTEAGDGSEGAVSEQDESEEDDEFEEDHDNEDLANEISVCSFESSFIFESYHKNTTQEQVTRKVTALAKRPLGKISKYTGYIYLFSTIYPGMVKIGYSKLHPKVQRLSSHRGCYQVIDMIWEKSTSNAFRVEQFVLAELSSVHGKLKEKCQKCKTHHREWLQIERETLERTILKWIAFVDTQPYTRQGMLKKNAVLPPPFSSDGGSGSAAQSTPTKGPRHSSPLSKIPDVTTKYVDSDEEEYDEESDEDSEQESDEESDKSGDDTAVHSLTERFRQVLVSKAERKTGR